MEKERRRTVSNFLQYLALISYQYDKQVLVMHADCVCVFVFFFFYKLLSYPCQQEPQCYRHGESRQLGWPLTSGINLRRLKAVFLDLGWKF